MMRKRKLVPKRRFEEFNDEWKEKKLGEVAEFNPTSILPDVFQYVDLESVIGTELINHRMEFKETAPSRAQRLAITGDVFYQTVRPYQKNNYLFELPYSNFVFSTGYAQMRPNIDSCFLLNRIQEGKFVFKVLDRCTGTSYPAINSNDLADIKIKIPENRLEQQKTGQFFKHLDEMITLEQRKIHKTKALKSAYLAEMFPAEGERVPKRRFGGFTDEWEVKKLGTFTNLITKGTTPKKMSLNGDVSLIKVENIKNRQIKPTSRISNDEHENYLKRSKLQENDILFSIAGTLGRTALVNVNVLPANTNQALAIIRGYDFDTSFLLTALDGPVVTDYIKQNPTIGAQPNLSLEQVGDLKISTPSKEEQQKIGEFFKKIDDTISNHQQKLEKLKATKQAYLHEMFV